MRKQMLAFLAQHPIATLVTRAKNNMLHTSTLYVYVDDDFNSYLLTKAHTRKCANVREQPSVALSFFDEEALLACEIYGDAYLVNMGDDVMHAVARIQEIITERQGESKRPPVAQYGGLDYIVIKIVPKQIEYRDFSHSAVMRTQPKYHRLTF